MVTANRRSNAPDVSGAVPTEILNAAESLFAAHGYDAVSVRNIADKAQVRLGLVSYYFPAKQQIFEAVVQRRAAVLHTCKIEALAAVTAAGSNPTAGDILRAFILPSVSLALEGGREWRDYSIVTGQLAQTDTWKALVHKHFDPTINEFVIALKKVVPAASEASLHYGMWFTAMCLISVLNSPRRLDEMTDGKVRTSDLETTAAWLVPFVTAGFSAIQDPQARPTTVARKRALATKPPSHARSRSK